MLTYLVHYAVCVATKNNVKNTAQIFIIIIMRIYLVQRMSDFLVPIINQTLLSRICMADDDRITSNIHIKPELIPVIKPLMKGYFAILLCLAISIFGSYNVLAAPSVSTQKVNQADIPLLLEKAKVNFKSYRLSTPPGDNALAQYRQVLQLDPKNTEAQQGLNKIVKRYIRLIEKAIEKDRYKKAELFVQRALSIGAYPNKVKQLLNKLRWIAGGKPEHGDTWTNSLNHNDYVWLAGGCFNMGSPREEAGRDDDENQHKVCVEGFWMAKRETTVRNFIQFAEDTNFRTIAELGRGCWGYNGEGEWGVHKEFNWISPGFVQELNHPVVCISLLDVNAYIRWLEKKTGKQFRLPTEAEWEYAARANTDTSRYWGNVMKHACRYANFFDQKSISTNHFPWQAIECDDGYAYTAPVGSYVANEFGLYDMLGNAWEWTCSEWEIRYQGAEKKCKSLTEYIERVNRGGGWSNIARLIRAAIRVRDLPDMRNDTLGFRLVRQY